MRWYYFVSGKALNQDLYHKMDSFCHAAGNPTRLHNDVCFYFDDPAVQMGTQVQAVVIIHG